MAHTLVTQVSTAGFDIQRWCLLRLLLPLFEHRRRISTISERSRRERLRLGYGRIPQRAWDRRSALFIDD